jgi:hypothetical protein
MEGPMLVLGFVWLGLLLVELVHGLSPLLEALGTAVWIIFVLNFIIEFVLVPRISKRGLPTGAAWMAMVPPCGGRRCCLPPWAPSY